MYQEMRQNFKSKLIIQENISIIISFNKIITIFNN